MKASSQSRTSFIHQIHPIRLGEFDLGGVLYHARYFHILEEIREAFLVKSGLPYSELISQSYHLPLTRSSQEFLAPIRYGDSLIGVMKVEELRKVKVKLAYEIHHHINESISPQEPEITSKKPIHRAVTIHACVKESNCTFQICTFPDKLFNSFSALLVDKSLV